MESLLEHAWDQIGFAYCHGPFGHRFGNGFNIHGLEVFLVQARARSLAGNAQNWDRVSRCGVQAGDHVCASGAGSANAHADIAGIGTGKTFGHVGSAFHVAGENVIKATFFAQCGVEGVDGGAGHAEYGAHAFFT